MSTYELRIEVTVEPASPEHSIGLFATDDEGAWFLVDTWHTMKATSRALAAHEALQFVEGWLGRPQVPAAV